MTPYKAKRELFLRAGLQGSPPPAVHEAAASAFCAAYQVVWASPKTAFFTEETKTVSVLIGTASYALAGNTLRIIGPVRFGGYDLIEVEQEAHFERPVLIGLSLASTGSPRIFHLDSGKNATTGAADLVDVTLKLKPTPTAAGTLTYRAATHPPRWTAWELEADTGSMPAPQEYFESAILPIAVRHLSRQPWFTSTEAIVAGIEADYAAALTLLGLINPSSTAK